SLMRHSTPPVRSPLMPRLTGSNSPKYSFHAFLPPPSQPSVIESPRKITWPLFLLSSLRFRNSLCRPCLDRSVFLAAVVGFSLSLSSSAKAGTSRPRASTQPTAIRRFITYLPPCVWAPRPGHRERECRRTKRNRQGRDSWRPCPARSS